MRYLLHVYTSLNYKVFDLFYKNQFHLHRKNIRKSDAVITNRLESTFRPPSLNELCVTLFMLTAYIESAFPTIKYFICMFI